MCNSCACPLPAALVREAALSPSLIVAPCTSSLPHLTPRARTVATLWMQVVRLGMQEPSAVVDGVLALIAKVQLAVCCDGASAAHACTVRVLFFRVCTSARAHPRCLVWEC